MSIGPNYLQTIQNNTLQAITKQQEDYTKQLEIHKQSKQFHSILAKIEEASNEGRWVVEISGDIITELDVDVLCKLGFPVQEKRICGQLVSAVIEWTAK